MIGRPFAYGLLLLLMSMSITLAEDMTGQRLAKLKAAYIYNVLKFTSWPANHLSDDNVFHVGVLGDDAVGNILQRSFQGRFAQNRRIQVHRIEVSDEELDGDFQRQMKICQMVYVSGRMSDDRPEIIELMKGSDTLLVGSGQSFAEQGGTVEILFDEGINRIRFVINMETLAGSRLSISSKLLKFADRIGP